MYITEQESVDEQFFNVFSIGRPMKVGDVLAELKSLATKDTQAMSVRRGVPADQLFGVSTGDIRKLANRLGQNSRLSAQLWRSTIHEAQTLAILIAPLADKSTAELGSWVADIESWDVCDLFAKQLAHSMGKDSANVSALTLSWISSDVLYTKRTGLALIANHCMRQKQLDGEFTGAFLGQIEQASTDNRQHVRQACCWALRELGKIDTGTHELAIALALELGESSNEAQIWIAKCAYKELELLVKIPDRRRLIARTSKSAAKYRDL